MVEDAQGHSLSGATAIAAEAYDRAVRAFNLVCGDPVGEFDGARQAAPDFAMAHLGKAWVFALGNDPGLHTQAAALVETAGKLTLNEREAAHHAALSHLCDGARAAAVAVLDRHLMRYPHDLVAHQGAALSDGFLGRFHWVRDRSARALPLWSKDQPGYGTVLAMHAFGLEESGDYARAEEESRAAAELEPLSFWPHHTVAHVMEMTGRPDDGLGWMAAREALWSSPEHLNRVHIWWHKSLFHLELGQYDAALALYDDKIRETQRPFALSLTNASALLWRLDTLGCAIGGRWVELADLWEGHADGNCLVFADIHAAMAELRAGREARVEARLAAMRATAASDAEAAVLYRDVGIPIVEGFMAFHRGVYAEAVERLLGVRYGLYGIGGSHAQRDVVTWTLIEAAIRAGQRDIALALAHERLGARPRSIPNRRFLRAAEALSPAS
ncbi:MAG TPA: tetratricopeptide repeat protein [Stellaceae bacterium]|jgi:tetratricopeptide (TPR) repeat protein|nr:tetratricopeptide repeat protein [Stellaceae bacterium]